MGELFLITGGARSGKSSYAQQLGETYPGSRMYIATCPAGEEINDRELAERIAAHRAARKSRGWETVEEQLDLIGSVEGSAACKVILIDCLTLWVNNLLYKDSLLSEDGIEQKGYDLLRALRECPGTVILVTNEVGCGIVPENEISRRFRDLTGRLNQVMASAADQVMLLVCGYPVVVKMPR